MTHVPIDLDRIDWSPFLNAQEGGGAVEHRYYKGAKFQRGFGVLGSIGRFLLPIAKQIASTATTEAAQAGQRILADVAEGRSLKQAATTHGRQGLQNLAERYKRCVKVKQNGQEGRGRRKRRYRDQLSSI